MWVEPDHRRSDDIFGNHLDHILDTKKIESFKGPIFNTILMTFQLLPDIDPKVMGGSL